MEKIVEILLANMASNVAIGFAYSNMFPVSTDSIKTKMLGTINPIKASIRYNFFIYFKVSFITWTT